MMKKEKYISFRLNKYRIDRRVNGKRINASFDTLELAVAVRDIYEQYGWGIDTSIPQAYKLEDTYYVLHKPSEQQLKVLFISKSCLDVWKFLEGYVDLTHIRQIEYGLFSIKNSQVVECIFKIRGRYRLSQKRDNVQCDYGTFMTFGEAVAYRNKLIKNNGDIGIESKQFLTYLFGSWWVFKSSRAGDGIKRFYHRSETKETAQMMRDYYLRVGFPEKPLFETKVLHNVTSTHKIYYVAKIVEGVERRWYAGHDLLMACAIRNIIEKNGWNNPPIREYKEYGYKLILDYNQAEQITLTVLEEPKYHLWETNAGTWKIHHYYKSWGTYPTRDIALEYAKFFNALNWNRDVYNALNEHICDKHISRYTRKEGHYLLRNPFNDTDWGVYPSLDDARIAKTIMYQEEGQINYDKYISHSNKQYVVELSIPPFLNVNTNVSTLDEAKKVVYRNIRYNPTTKTTRKKYTKKAHKPKIGNPKQYIRKAHNKEGGYEITKYINGKLCYFGRYATIDDAIKYRDMYFQHDWDLDYYHELYDVYKRKS